MGAMGTASRSVIASALASLAVAASPVHAEVSFEEKRLFTVPVPPAGWLEEDWEPIISADGRRGAALVPLWRGAKPRQEFQSGPRGTKRCNLLVVDDRVVDPCNWSDASPTFSPDGRHVVYVRAHRHDANIYVDGTEVVRPSDVPRGAGMLADGTLAYVLAAPVPKGRSKERLIVGDHEDPPFEGLVHTTLSPDGSAVAYVGRNADRETVMVRGRKLGDFDSVYAIAWTPDGREVVVFARALKCQPPACWCISRGGVCVPEDHLGPGPWAFSPDGARVALVHQRSLPCDGCRPGRDDRYWVTYGAMRGPEVLDVRAGPVIDARGAHVAYAALVAGGGVRVFRDAQPVGELLQQGGQIAFSPDGAHLAWSGSAGGHFHVFVDGVPAPAHDWVYDVKFDPAGKQVAYAARDQPGGPWRIIAGTASGPACDWVGPLRWSADGKRVAYAARIGREVWWKVLPVP